MLFHYHPIHVGLATLQVIINQGLIDFEVSWSSGLWYTYLFEMGFTYNLLNHETLCIACHVGFFIHSNFLSPLVQVYLTCGRAVKGHGEGKGASLFLAQGMWKDRAFPVGRPIKLWIWAPITSLWRSSLLPLHIHGVLRRHMDRGSWIASEEYAE